MSDDLELRSGRIVAVDTETLRHAAAAFENIGGDAMRARTYVSDAAAQASGSAAVWRVRHLEQRMATLVERAADIAQSLRVVASAYEVVELTARREAARAAGDEAVVRRLSTRIERVAEATDWSQPLASAMLAVRPDPHAEIKSQALWGAVPFGSIGLAGAQVVLPLLGLVRHANLGAVSSPPPLRTAPEPRLTLIESRAGTAPKGVRDVVSRVPAGGPGGIRVERYTMAGGARRFAVYVTGTRTMKSDSADVFDLDSNLNLYRGRDADSLAAVRAALREAGAKPGDPLLLSGHSQGAMAASHLALEGDYDVTTFIGIGNPVQADLGAGTLHVDLRHTDDPVSALAAGGHDATIGAPGSFVAERTADPLPSLADVKGEAHFLSHYADTAEMLDASSDPRMDAVRERIAEFDGAASVDVFVFDAADGEPPR